MKNNRRPLALLAPLALAAAAALTGCAGSGGAASGTYVAEYEGLVVVDGDTVTWGEHSCDDVTKIDAEDDRTSVGTLDKTRTTIAWTQEGRWSKTDPFTESEDGSVISIGDKSWVKIGTGNTDAILADEEKGCAKYEETQAKRKEAKAEREAEAAGVASQYEAAASKVIDAFMLAGPVETGDTAVLEQLLQKNGITAAEMLEYLAADEDVMMDLQAKSPEQLEALAVGLQLLVQQ